MEEKSFFYIDKNGVQQGPRTIKQLENEYVITRETMVWCQGMADWRKAAEVEELNGVCDSRPPVLEVHVHNEPQAEKIVQPVGPCPHTWLIESILSTLFCCVVTGIVGIIYASKVENLWLSGHYEEARAAANTAKIWFIVGTALAIVSVIAYFSLVALAFIPMGMSDFVSL